MESGNPQDVTVENSHACDNLSRMMTNSLIVSSPYVKYPTPDGVILRVAVDFCDCSQKISKINLAKCFVEVVVIMFGLDEGRFC